MRMIDIINFGEIKEEDGVLIFKNFHINGNGTDLSVKQALLTSVIERLKKELNECTKGA
jgi:hypothetical protein